jgi:hypothetical protein
MHYARNSNADGQQTSLLRQAAIDALLCAACACLCTLTFGSFGVLFRDQLGSLVLVAICFGVSGFALGILVGVCNALFGGQADAGSSPHAAPNSTEEKPSSLGTAGSDIGPSCLPFMRIVPDVPVSRTEAA